MPVRVSLLVDFTHARKVRHEQVRLGWFRLRLPHLPEDPWALGRSSPQLAVLLPFKVQLPSPCRSHKTLSRQGEAAEREVQVACE